MITTFILASVIGWGVNTMLTPEPEPVRPICQYIEPYKEGHLSTPIWCDEVED